MGKPIGLRQRTMRRRRAELRYRLNRLALYLLLASYVPLVLATVAAIGWGLWLLWATLLEPGAPGKWWLARAWPWAAGLTLVGLAVSAVFLLGLLPLFFREVDDEPLGVRLAARQHPNLFAVLERICRRLGVTPPEHCVLTPEADAGIGDPRLCRPDGCVERTRTLMLGAGLVVHTTVAQFATIVCHELAHAAAGDTRFGRLADRFYDSMLFQLMPYEDDDEAGASVVGTVLRWLLSAYFKVFQLVYLADDRYREYRADRAAAEICGPQNLRDTLMKIHLPNHLPELSIGALWEEYTRNEHDLANIYAEHLRRWRELPPARRAAAENEAFMEQTGLWDTHPCLSDRMRNTADVAGPELAADRPATALFRCWSALEEQVTAMIMGIGRAQHEAYLRELSWRVRSGR